MNEQTIDAGELARQNFQRHEAERRKRAEQARRTLFDLLRAGGFDRAELWYEGSVEMDESHEVRLFKGAKKVARKHVTAELAVAAGDYLDAHLPDGWLFEEGGYGIATVFVASGYTFFRHTQLTAERDWFTDGEPGPDVPEDFR